MQKIKITILDAYTTNPGDLSWHELEALGETSIYDRTPPGEVVTRALDADIVLTNKVVLNEPILSRLPNLKCICVLATGYNIVDVEAARTRNIPVCNVKGYAAQSAAQHVFALLLELTNQVGKHEESVRQGMWKNSEDFSYTIYPLLGLADKTMGIYGFGQIGRKVACIARAFGMKVIAHHKHPKRDETPGVTFVSFDDMMKNSDVVSLHAPLTAENREIIHAGTLSLMKKTAFLINTGRGGLINEADLKTALESDQIAGAGLDVLQIEPPKNGNLLIGARNCIITPHQAWATREARQKLISETALNVKAFLSGHPINTV